MPSEKILEQKKSQVAGLVDKLKNAKAGVLVEYKGINVADDTALRAKMRAAGIDYSVIKNTLTKLAAKEAGLDGLDDVFFGTTSLAVSTDDILSPAKQVFDFAKSHDFFKIKCGFVEGKVITADEVKALALIPSKEVLLAQLLGLLTCNIRGLAIALKAIADKGEAA